MTRVRFLRFGIQSLDRLIGTVKLKTGDEVTYGIDVSEPEDSDRDPSTNGAGRLVLPITSSICLAGPDGTGKSVLSLHLASRYLTDCLLECVETGRTDDCPNLKVLYISTDLTYKMALKGWKDFALDRPMERKEPLVDLKEGRKQRSDPQIEIALKQYSPSAGKASDSVVKYLENYAPKFRSKLRAEVCFVDLASSTAGDDWGFVHRLLSGLDEPDPLDPRHLVLLDAVEGFETLVGDLNAFGEKSSRRSRIAQVMRLAAAKCHLLLVVEEGHQQRFPEEFVTDVVIRLRNVHTGRYVRRTVEIEKARGQSHRRGQHPYVIRDGVGSTTGSQLNADDPEVFLGNPHQKKLQSYVHIFPSLDYLSREIMIDKYAPPIEVSTKNKTRFAAFGLPYLDNMLGGKGDKAERASDGESDTRGLDCGSSTALIGDSLTQKSRLGKAFLSRMFYPFVEDLRRETARVSEGRVVKDWIRQVEDAISELAYEKEKAEEKASEIAQKLIENVTQEVDRIRRRLTENATTLHPVAVLFTTHDENVKGLANEFYQWLREEDGYTRDRTPENMIRRFARQYKRHVIDNKQRKSRFRTAPEYITYRDRFKRDLMEMALETVVKSHIEEHTICRRFEIHDLPAPVLMNIFQRSVEKAQRKLFRSREDQELPDRPNRMRESWRIRVVIDDLNAFRNTFPEIREDPLMLPSLLFMLGREGITSLIVDTQASGSPELPITERFDSSVRQLVESRIYIWRLPFYGESRVAISVIPPKSHEYRGLIRELRWDTTNESRTDRSLTVDPHFELYTGLEKAQPQPVPLEIRLYSDSDSVSRYIAMEELILREIFTPVVRDNTPPHVIIPAQRHEYEPLRDTCHIQRDTRLDHTTILQVNEFWWLRRPRQKRAGAFRPQWAYLDSVTATFRDNHFRTDPVADPFWVFQPRPAEESSAQANESSENNGIHSNNSLQVKRKRDFFDPDCGYGLRTVPDSEQDYIDRVPYTWDFGFLLCNGKAWEDACELNDPKNGRSRSEKGKEVARVWNELRKPTDDRHTQQVTWREFLAASKLVAEFQSFRTSTKANAFDFTMLIPESFSCLMLEMWLSESYDSLRKYEGRATDETSRDNFTTRIEMLKEVGKRRWSGTRNHVTLLKNLQEEREHTMQEILDARTKGKFQCFSLELYKVWLLLTEALNFEDLVDSSSYLNFEFKSKDVSPIAVSARHWYKTASTFFDSLTPEQVEYDWVPVRLPGHFSVRADWFLAVAGGSRSNRLADHALDLLSSQRANVTRLQEGIGLPTRRLFDQTDKQSHLRTRLISAPKGEALKNVEYDALRRIGAQANPENEEFYWLWRSGIWAYNRHSRIWHKWLNRALLWWHAWHQRYGSSWANGFEVYDLLTDIEYKEGRIADESREKFEKLNLDSWNKFHELRNILIAELEQVSVSTE